jgi:chromosome partitioning protein
MSSVRNSRTTRRRAWICAVVGSKGGVGKSTTAISLAVEWHRRGLSVLMVDADRQGTLRTWYAVRRELGLCDDEERLHVVHLDSDERGPDDDERKAALIRRVVPTLAEGFDLCLLDTPPSNDEVQRAAIAIADQVVLPTGPHAADLWGLVPMLDLVRAERDGRRKLVASVMRNKVRAATVASRHADEALGEMALPLLEARLGNREDYGRATPAGAGVTQWCPSSDAAAEVKALATELEAVSKGGIPVIHGDGGRA